MFVFVQFVYLYILYMLRATQPNQLMGYPLKIGVMIPWDDVSEKDVARVDDDAPSWCRSWTRCLCCSSAKNSAEAEARYRGIPFWDG